MGYMGGPWVGGRCERGLGRMYRTYGRHPSPLHGRCVRHEISNSIREQLVMAGGRRVPAVCGGRAGTHLSNLTFIKGQARS